MKISPPLRLTLLTVFIAAIVFYFNACSNTSSTSANGTDTTRDLTITITGGPSDGGVSAASTIFTFSVAAGTPTFACTLDSAPLGSCDPAGVALAGLAGGIHTFTVQATDSDGTGPLASVTWTVDASAPALVIVSPADGATVPSTFAMQFTTDDSSANHTCTLDGAPFACAPGASNTLSSIASGAHTIEVTGVDSVGNQSAVQVTVNVL